MEFWTEIVYLVPPYSYSKKSKASIYFFLPKQIQVISGHDYKKDIMNKEGFEDIKTSEDVNRWTENTMVNRKGTKGQALIYKTLHRPPLKRTGL